MAGNYTNLDKKKRSRGRPKGSTGVVDFRRMFAKNATIETFEALGGIEAFITWARANPDLFYVKLFGKMIPTDIHITEEEKKAPLPINLIIVESQTAEIGDRHSRLLIESDKGVQYDTGD